MRRAALSSPTWLGGAAFCLLVMAFTYGPTASPPFDNPPIDFPRLLISDTQQFLADGVTRAYIFEDAEILNAARIAASFFQSSMFFSIGAAGQFIPSQPVAYLRTAAFLLDSLASNKSRLAGIQQMLDVKIDASKAAAALQDQAKVFRETDDNAGAFAIIEQCNDSWSFYERFWKQVQRQSGGL